MHAILLSASLLAAGATGGALAARIEGRITDPSGGALPGVAVETHGPSARVVTTDVAGGYRLTSLAPGTYELSCRLPGFLGASRRVDLSAGEARVLDVVLELLIADLFNIFDAPVSDVEYDYVSRLPGEPAGGVADIHSHPASPRTVRVSAAYAF